ncbi:MAG: hypothetical protein ACXADY_05435 [Candidatus Hodarchaeales archaeon]
MQLFLGIVPGIFPWLEEPCIHKKMIEKGVGIVFSYWIFRKKHPEIISKGFHDYFSYDGPIMLDSGAYSAFNSGVNIQIEDYSSFLSAIDIQDNDIVVNLDVVGNPKKSQQNWIYLIKRFDFNVLPVIHLPEKGNFYLSENYVGLGGMVPAFKINQPGSVYDVVSWLISLPHTTKKRYHGFGIGSPFHQIAFQEYLYSIDWIGWRRNAAVCSCYTPEGSVYIHEARKKKKKGKSLTSELFELYTPPFIDSYEMLYKSGTEGWVHRAFWNVWWFLVAEDYREKIDTSKYVLSLQKRILQTQLESQTVKLDQFFHNSFKKNDNHP